MERSRAGADDELLCAIRSLLDLVNGAESLAEEDLCKLQLALDRLALEAHDPAGAPGTATIAPGSADQATRARVTARFPRLGYYRDGSLDLADGEPLVGDAVDDLVDIVDELTGVLWLWENVGEADARWQFSFGFETHWGSHLRSLQWYLHERGVDARLTG